MTDPTPQSGFTTPRTGPDAVAPSTPQVSTSNKSVGGAASDKFRFTNDEDTRIRALINLYKKDIATLDETLWAIEAAINEGWQTCNCAEQPA